MINPDIIDEAQQLIQSIVIPSPPKLLIELQSEMNKPEPDYKKLIECVRQDMAMTARVIKTANSPFFGIRNPVENIHTAISILGLENFRHIIMAAALREAMKGKYIPLKEFETFYNHSMWIAQIAQLIVKNIQEKKSIVIDAQQAYLAGLFHNCGMPIMAKKYKAYFPDVRAGIKRNQTIIQIEEELYKTNHAIVGSLIAGAWDLPETICKSIQLHHETDVSHTPEKEIQTLSAIIILAQTMLHRIKKDSEFLKIYTHFISNREDFQKLFTLSELSIQSYLSMEEKVTEIVGE